MVSSNHLLLNNKVLTRLCYFLSIRDIVILGQTCQILLDRIFNDGEIWKQRNLICQPQDRRWLLQSNIQQLIRKIPRHHELQTLKIHDLPALDTMSFFLILDHCAHSVHHLDLMMTLSQCNQLCKHLEAFCFHLATCQAWNKIPLTLHQYTLDSPQLYKQAELNLASSSSQPFFINQLISHGLPTKMDDPPFEMLDRLTVTLSPNDNHPPSFLSYSGDTSSLPPTMLINKFHHLIELLSRYSPTLTCSNGSSETNGAAVRSSTTIIPTPACIQTPPPLSLSVSSVDSSIATSSSILHIADIIDKRPLSLTNKESAVSKQKKRKKQQAEDKRKQDYYDRIHQLSHQCRPRSLSNSPPPSPSTPPPQHRVDTFISSPTTTTRRQQHHASTPIVHVMRCHPQPIKK